jgi:hypothetical protein
VTRADTTRRMAAMNLSRLGAGTTLAVAILTAWMGACANGVEVCGVEGFKNGTCQVGPSCPSGSAELLISDPSDSCPASNSPAGLVYICCVPTPDGAATSSSNDASQTPDATRSGMDATVTKDATPPVDAGVDVAPPSNDTGAPDTGMDTTAPPTDTGTPDTGSGDTGSRDTGSGDTGSGDTGSGDTGSVCGGGTACTAASTCTAQSTLCVTNTCTAGCCGTVNAASGGTCTDNGGVVCDGNGTCVECNVDGDCPTGGTCQMNKCTLKANGAACTTSSQCANSHCASGTCCNTACAGTCQACTMARTGGADGTCANVTTGMLAPTGQCAATLCGNDGNCAAGACEQTPSGTACGAAVCLAGQLTAATTCGGGTCNGAGAPSACAGGFICASGTACKTACASNADCQAAGFFCQNPGAAGTCVALEAPGSACIANIQCVSGVCDVAGSGDCCTASCVGGVCGATSCNNSGACVYPGNSVAPPSLQTPGDCQKIVCAGNGSVTSVDDATDLPTPTTVCETNPACVGPSPLTPGFTSAPTGTSCTADGHPPDAVCGDTSNANVAGTCVQCNTTGDCSGIQVCVLNVCQ